MLYAFQGRHDCSFTHFRVLDILLRRRHTYRFPLDRHPDHAERCAYFAGYDSWLEDGYVDPPFLYCDAGTALWRRMADAGELQGPDAVPPDQRAPAVVAEPVVEDQRGRAPRRAPRR